MNLAGGTEPSRTPRISVLRRGLFGLAGGDAAYTAEPFTTRLRTAALASGFHAVACPVAASSAVIRFRSCLAASKKVPAAYTVEPPRQARKRSCPSLGSSSWFRWSRCQPLREGLSAVLRRSRNSRRRTASSHEARAHSRFRPHAGPSPSPVRSTRRAPRDCPSAIHRWSRTSLRRTVSTNRPERSRLASSMCSRFNSATYSLKMPEGDSHPGLPPPLRRDSSRGVHWIDEQHPMESGAHAQRWHWTLVPYRATGNRFRGPSRAAREETDSRNLEKRL